MCKKLVTLLNPGFFLWLLRVYNYGTLIRASLLVLISLEIITIIRHERGPRIEKMQCLAQKLKKLGSIEKMCENAKLTDIQN